VIGLSHKQAFTDRAFEVNIGLVLRSATMTEDIELLELKRSHLARLAATRDLAGGGAKTISAEPMRFGTASGARSSTPSPTSPTGQIFVSPGDLAAINGW
jgi:hypothetical protein